jgi:hypothetical protein
VIDGTVCAIATTPVRAVVVCVQLAEIIGVLDQGSPGERIDKKQRNEQ